MTRLLHRIARLHQRPLSTRGHSHRRTDTNTQQPVSRAPFKPPMVFVNSPNLPVQLNPIELQLVTWLKECTSYLKNSSASHLLFDEQVAQNDQEKNDQLHHSYQALELRIAGGWVRDKLLGVETNDLDIGISSLTGQEFARIFSNYIKLRQQESSDREEENATTTTIMGKISTIEARPDQSKHLETATTNFLGLDLDFVQLRSEDYGSQNLSRIPTSVTFGTPLEDALRRDITINSLFYNIHTGLIEDHTEKGLKDLENGLIRTPLSACQTFQDDPLRLLRCIRFATRFGFQLDEDIIIAAKSESIKNALMEKVSRERVGIEMDKMLKGPDPLSSLKLIEELGLYELVFITPKGTETSKIDSSLAIRAARWLDYFIHQNQQTSSSINPSLRAVLPTLHPQLVHFLSTPSSSPLIRRLFLACAVLPYRPFVVKSGKKQVCAADLILMDSLKFGNHDKNFVSHLLQSLELLNTSRLESSLSSSNIRLDLGSVLRSPHVHDLKMVEDNASLVWQASFLFALVHEFVSLESDTLASSSSFDDVGVHEKAVKIIDTFQRTITSILELDLTLVVTPEFEKRRLDGKEICQILGIKPGKQVAKIIEKLIDQQIQFPNLSKQEASTWLKNHAHDPSFTN